MAASFKVAYELVLAHEGGYVNDPQDPGGETYRGVARKIWGNWEGWTNVDLQKQRPGFPANLEKDLQLQEHIASFYEVNFWSRIRGNEFDNQEVANSIFDFAVNAGVSTSASLAQMVVGEKADGVIGPDSLTAINRHDTELFLASFTLAKIARYVSIVKKRPTSQKFFYGWVRRAIGD